MQISYLQTKEWAGFKTSQGWIAHWLSQNKVADVLVLERKLPHINKTMLYIPEVILPKDPKNILNAIKELAKDRNAMLVRLEILSPENEPSQPDFPINELQLKNKDRLLDDLTSANYIKSFEDVQPTWRQWLFINQPDDKILAQMKPKGRYNIKVAQKHKVKVIQTSGDQPSSEELVKRVHKLYLETARRDGFSPRSVDYFIKLTKDLGTKVKVLLASHEGQDLAGMILIMNNGMASYVYGASSNEKRNLMAPYLLHYSAIQVAKEENCSIYDLLAVAPLDKNDKDGGYLKGHNYAGLSRFKTQFGGETVEVMGSYDLILEPIWYRIFSFLEKRRRNQ